MSSFWEICAAWCSVSPENQAAGFLRLLMAKWESVSHLSSLVKAVMKESCEQLPRPNAGRTKLLPLFPHCDCQWPAPHTEEGRTGVNTALWVLRRQEQAKT